jgi:hypothetical protein
MGICTKPMHYAWQAGIRFIRVSSSMRLAAHLASKFFRTAAGLTPCMKLPQNGTVF